MGSGRYVMRQPFVPFESFARKFDLVSASWRLILAKRHAIAGGIPMGLVR